MPTAPKPVPRPRPAAPPPPRASSAARGYGGAHRKARSRLLSQHPVCQVCGDAFATDMHHIDRNPHNLYPANLMAVCERCHHGTLHG